MMERYYRMGIVECLKKYAASVADVQAAKLKPIELPGSSLVAWLVDGTRIRDDISIEFIGGGHHYVYPWIPENEVWIAADTPAAEREAFLVHELYERALMLRGMDYDAAHEMASQLEKHVRDNPEALPGAITTVIAQNERLPVEGVKPAKEAGAKRRA